VCCGLERTLELCVVCTDHRTVLSAAQFWDFKRLSCGFLLVFRVRFLVNYLSKVFNVRLSVLDTFGYG